MRVVWVAMMVAVLHGCPRGDKKPNEPAIKKDAGGGVAIAADDAGLPVLPPAPPTPSVPSGLDPAIVTAKQDRYPSPLPESIALGELLFHEPRLAKTGALACATC